MPNRVTLALFAATLVLGPDLAAQQVDTTFVTVHGHRMALYVTGKSGPTVVLEAGGGSWHRDWVGVVPKLEGQARVIAYDRPGYALSERCDSPRTAQRVSEELRAALAAAGFRDPFVLVGWSLGGAFARVFAGNFPELVTGLVLVDPAPEEFYRRMAREFPDEWSQMTAGHWSEVFRDSTRRSEQGELAAFEASMEQARASDTKHQKRSIVLIAGRDDELATDPISKVWIAALTRWATDRPNTSIRTVPRSGHHIPRQHPDTVAGAILDLLKTGGG